MAALATPAELATYLQTATEDEATAGNPDLLDTLRATQLLENASANVRDECGWNITTETVTAQRIPPRQLAPGFFNLPTLHLTAFALTVDGVLLVDGTDYVWELDGRVELVLPRSVLSTTDGFATYTHGYSTTPHSVREVCLELAAAAYPNPSRYRSESIDPGYTTVYTRIDLHTETRLNKYRLPPGVA